MMRTERTYYLVFGLYSFSWSVLGPVYPLFLLSRGLDLLQINLVLATYLITSFVFEVPTGAVADLAGRKRAFLLSCGVRMAAFILYAFAGNFTDCLRAEFIDAIGTTLASGALEAWAVDGMRAEGSRVPADHFFARAQMTSRVLMIVAGVGAGYLAEHGLELPWFVGAAAFGITGIVGALWMQESAVVTSGGASRSLVRSVREGLVTVRRVPVLRLLCAITLVGAFGIMPIHMLWQPWLQTLTGQGTSFMGWIWALLNVAAVTGSALIPRLLGRVRRERVLWVVALWRGAMLVLAGTAVGVAPAVLGLLLQEVGMGISEPLVQSWVNEHIAAAQRATVLSVRAMCFTFGGGAGLVCIGLLARRFGIPIAWCASASVLSLTALGFVALERVRARSAAAAVAVGLGGTPVS